MDWMTIGIRAGSSLLGAFIALVFQPPRTMGELWRRLTFSSLVGFFAGEPLRTEYLHWPESWENVSASFIAPAALSWFSAPIILRMLAAFTPPKPK